MSARTFHQKARQLQKLGRFTAAETAYRQALGLNPTDPELHYDLGGLLLDMQYPEQAESCYRTALALAPNHPQILLQLGNALAAQGKHKEAAIQFRASLAIDPTQYAACYNLGNALRDLGQFEGAAECYRVSLRLDPNYADCYNNLGNVLRQLGRLDEAIACYREALRLDPNLHHARMHLLHQRQHICDWADMDAEIAEIRRLVNEEPRALISPFAFLALPGTTPAEQLRCAQNWAANRYAGLQRKSEHHSLRANQHDGSRLKIGYLSADLRAHPMAWLITELIELHDRSHFTVYAYSYGPDDGSPERQRLQRAFDHFLDARAMGIQETARRIRADGIDILIDLTGYTQMSRSGILALRPAPIQVNWIGYPGSMGAPFVDYLLSDAFVTPPSLAMHYSERLVLLPHTYYPNNSSRPVAAIPSRTDCGLPANSIVLCCFNQTFKITPAIFAIWMEVLRIVPDSVLWLLECNRWARGNLLREAETHGVSSERLLFAPRVPIAEHLARHRCADLFLDTLPYNAHTTACDALWMGLPVLTCAGETFASRVAGSLLHAAGLAELITTSLADYRALAIELATQPERLRALRKSLDESREHMLLFDTACFVRHLEQRYREMWDSYLTSCGKPANLR